MIIEFKSSVKEKLYASRKNRKSWKYLIFVLCRSFSSKCDITNWKSSFIVMFVVFLKKRKKQNKQTNKKNAGERKTYKFFLFIETREKHAVGEKKAIALATLFLGHSDYLLEGVVYLGAIALSASGV